MCVCVSEREREEVDELLFKINFYGHKQSVKHKIKQMTDEPVKNQIIRCTRQQKFDYIRTFRQISEFEQKKLYSTQQNSQMYTQ